VHRKCLIETPYGKYFQGVRVHHLDVAVDDRAYALSMRRCFVDTVSFDAYLGH
jgi:hypothetical protein